MNHCLLTLYLFSGGLSSCDPARRIEMKNRRNDTAVVIWKSKEDGIATNPFNISNNRELKFTIPPHKKSKIKISFSDGTWSPDLNLLKSSQPIKK